MSRALVVIDVQNEYFQGRLPIYNTKPAFPTSSRRWITPGLEGFPSQ